MTSRFRFITVSANHSFNCFGEPPQTDLFAEQNNIIICVSVDTKTVKLLVHFRAILHQTLTRSTQRSLACVYDLLVCVQAYRATAGLPIIIGMHVYIYHALINALNAQMIHINLNTIFYTHVACSPTETIYIKYYMIWNTHTHTHTHTHTDTHTDCNRNGVSILVGAEILGEEEGFQFGFKI